MTQTREEVINLSTWRLMESALGGLSPRSGDVEIAESDGFGSLLLGLVPGFVVRTGLVSNTVQIDGVLNAAGTLVPEAGRIYAVMDEAGAAEFAIIHVGVPLATEVLVTYDAAGVPTLTFLGAVTGYQVEKSRLPADFVAKMTQVFA